MDWQHLYGLATAYVRGADVTQVTLTLGGAAVALFGTALGGYRATRLALRVLGWLLLPLMTLAGGVVAWLVAGPKLSDLAMGVLAEFNRCPRPELTAGVPGVHAGRARAWGSRPHVEFAGASLDPHLSRADRRAIRRRVRQLTAIINERRRDELTRQVWGAA